MTDVPGGPKRLPGRLQCGRLAGRLPRSRTVADLLDNYLPILIFLAIAGGFGVLLLASFELPHDFELEVNVGAAAVGQTRPNGYLAQVIATASLSYDITPSLLGFLEMLSNSADERGGRGLLAVNVGLVYRLTRRLAIDAGIQTSLAGQGPDYVVRTGLSVLWR